MTPDWNEFKAALQLQMEDVLDNIDDSTSAEDAAKELTDVAVQAFIEWQNDDNPGSRIFRS